MTRKIDYLFQPRDSRNWHIRLQGGLAPRIERSLGTADRIEAEIIAAPMIAEHRQHILRRRQIAATMTRENKLGIPHGSSERAAAANGDDGLIETYLKHSGNAPGTTHETWRLFKALCPGVKLKDATRDDGRKLVAHLQAQGLKSATIRRRLVPLKAAVNFAIKEGQLKFNPFSDIVPNGDDSERRLPFTDDDMQVIRDNLDKLAPADRLMVTMLATTGMNSASASTSRAKQPNAKSVSSWWGRKQRRHCGVCRYRRSSCRCCRRQSRDRYSRATPNQRPCG